MELSIERLQILAALVDANGSVEDRQSGQATRRLLGYIFDGEPDKQTVARYGMIIRDLEESGYLVRDLNGKRCYEITLIDIPEEWKALVEATRRFPDAHIVEVEKTIEIPADPDLVAASIIRQVHEILSAGDADTAMEERYNEMSRRLADTLEDNQRLRTKLREVGDELVLYKRRNERLAKEKTELEDNLKAAIKSNSIDLTEQAREALANIMRQAPTTKGD